MTDIIELRIRFRPKTPEALKIEYDALREANEPYAAFGRRALAALQSNPSLTPPQD